MSIPPVAFFGFNRPACTRIVFEAIRQYRPEQLFLIADGPRPTVPTDKARCAAVREIMQAVDWPCEVRVNFAEQNMGCKKRMSSGVDWVFSQVEEAIFLEDDCVPSPEFFGFCAELLARYRDVDQIVNIAGTSYQNGQVRGDASYYFSRYPHIWGWASWRRAWQHYDVAMRSWPQAKEEQWVSRFFSDPVERAFWNRTIEKVYVGEVDTWDMQWAYACWRQDGLGVIPNANLICNIGAGPDATHTKGPVGSLEMPTGILGELRHPKSIAVDLTADKFTFDTHYGGEQLRREAHPLMLVRRALSKLKRIPQKLLEVAGLKIQRIRPPAPASGPLLFGRFKVETDNVELIRTYRDFPQSNSVLSRLLNFLARQGPASMIDIGANCGDSLAIAKMGSLESEILCIEGDESLLPVLTKNAKQFPGVTIKSVYLGETASQVNVSIKNLGWNNTLVPDEGGKAVEIHRLDEVVRDWKALPNLRFIKCDTEGYDVRVLLGARETLRTYQPVVLFEYNRDAMRAAVEEGLRIFPYFAELGYHQVLIYDNFGRFILSTDLDNASVYQDLHAYAYGEGPGIYYFDILVFARKDAESATAFLKEERLYREKS